MKDYLLYVRYSRGLGSLSKNAQGDRFLHRRCAVRPGRCDRLPHRRRCNPVSNHAKAPNMTLIRGDHEQMCLDALGPDGSLRRRTIWYQNGGHPTFLELRHSYAEPKRADILHYLAGSPDHVEVEVNHRCFYLVHGLPGADTRTRLWGRPSSSIAAPLSGCTAVVGHTPTPILNGPLDDPYVIWHGNGIIGIDCGCEGSDDLRKLACLRLEDLAEFYV